MDLKQLRDDARKQEQEALRLDDLSTAYHYFKQAQYLQDEMNKMQNQRIDNQNMMLNSMYKIKSGGVVFSSTPNFTTAISPEDEERWKQQRELEVKRNTKIFIHHAKLFADRYPNWTVTPDPKNPFNNVILEHKNGKYVIETSPHNNDLLVYGTETEPKRRTTSFIKKFGIPHNVFKISPIEVGRNVFYGWSVGMEDAPSWVRE